jgi:hypothetical protein
MTRIGLIPLDERPVNTHYPHMLAQIVGIELFEPDFSILSHRRQPGDSAAIANWLREHAPVLDALVVAVPTLGYGGLVASRITDESAAQTVQRLNVLREIRQQYPELKVFIFDLIMRTSRSNDSTEEPAYWRESGARIYEYQQLWDKSRQGQDVTQSLADIKENIPTEYLHDFTQRRLRNHIVNLTEIDMLAQGLFDLLVISSDDTSEYGMGSQEKRWLREHIARLNIADERLLLYPGADEVGSVLLARAINHIHQFKPRLVLQVAIPGDEEMIAPFEDSPVRVTVERQIRALGGELVDDLNEADFIVAMNPPSRTNPAQVPDPDAIQADRPHREAQLKAFAAKIQNWVEAGRAVIVVDVAYANGSDTTFVEALREHVALEKLAAYGAWNTAGNTIGVALAQGIMGHFATDKVAQERFLVHRFVEDWAYQALERAKIWREAYSHEEYLARADLIIAQIERNLQKNLADLKPFGDRWRIVAGSVHHPWQRLFEVDFDLEQI